MLAPFYHVGIIVPELGRAQRDLTDALGLRWAGEQRTELPVLIDGNQVTRDIGFVYSVDGPPHVELIAATEPPWSAQEGLHHMGMWTEDVVADMDALVADGYTVAATGVNRKGTSAGFAYLRNPAGFLLELVDVRSRASFDRWLGGGDYL